MKILYISFLFVTSITTAQTFQGPFSPSWTENTSCPFSYSSIVDYLPAENVSESDDIYATASHCDCCDANTRCFEAKGFGFNIPSSAIVVGILVEVEKKSTGGSMVQDNGVQLTKAGNVVGVSKATSANWPSSDAYFSYGGSNDLWGAAWLPEEINDSSFGIALASISYTCFGNGVPSISYIDHIRISVYYTDEATNVFSLQTLHPEKLMVIPNPTSGAIQFSVPGDDYKVTIVVSDVAGNILDEKTIATESGNGTCEFDLDPGVYIIQARASSGTFIERLMVRR